MELAQAARRGPNRGSAACRDHCLPFPRRHQIDSTPPPPATVKLCTDRKTGTVYAAKAIDRKKIKGKESDVISEIEIMAKLEHPNLARVYESFELKDEIYLILDLAEGGELLDAIISRGEFSENDAAIIIKQLIEGLVYLHKKGVVHRDLKPENILFKKPGDNHILITDFGFSRLVGTSHFLQTICGTPAYVAPEILNRGGHGIEVDMWSAGCIAYSMLCGYLPFASETGSQAEMFELIKKGSFSFPIEDWGEISDEAKDFISKLLVVDPSARMRSAHALQHPWLEKFARPPEEKPAAAATNLGADLVAPDISGTIKRNSMKRNGIATLKRMAVQAKVVAAFGDKSGSSLSAHRVANAPSIPKPEGVDDEEVGELDAALKQATVAAE
ncbi:kinase-like domain-containing protein [Hyaloraphidium curvatum]|nr:kinase-like domain-containing protein [Hyaloraphidium curvatum]